jgi:outer membrane protein assembly factor BamB
MMTRVVGRVALAGLAGLLVTLNSGSASASTCASVALGSNILVADGCVVFAQGTGSLTVLDLATGNVLLRKKPGKNIYYGGTLEQSPHGVLMIRFGSVALLDRKTFEPIWQANGCYDTAFDGECLCSHDGDHTVSCRDVQTGEIRWKKEMKDGWEVLAAKGKVVVFTPEFWDGRFVLQVLDLKSGEKILRHEARPDTHWLHVYFDGDSVYTVDKLPGPSTVKSKPGHLVALNLNGEVVAETACGSAETTPSSDAHWNGRFFWRDKFFDWDGRVRPTYENEQRTVADLWEREDYFPESLPTGVLVRRQAKDGAGKTRQVIQMTMPQGSWSAYEPHFGESAGIDRANESQGSLLLGSTEGQLECLDVKTGRPKWIYVFPVICRTMSFSTPYGMPPYLTQQAERYWQGVEQMGVVCGSVPLPEGLDAASAKWNDLAKPSNYAARVTIDPSPDDPFPGLSRCFFWLALYTLTPIIIAVFVLLVRRARRRRMVQDAQPPVRRGAGIASLGIWCLVFSLSPALGLLEFGRVSYAWTLALKVVFALTILCSAYATSRLYLQKRWIPASMLAAILVVWIYWMRYPWWFA